MTVRRLKEQDEWVCDECGGAFAVPSQHWSKGSCSWPDLSHDTMEVIVGMVLGDGHIEPRNSSRFVAEMTNKKFIEWLYDEIGWLTTQAVRSKTASEMYEKEHERDFYNTDNPEFRPVYRVATMGHPELNKLHRMYGSNGKIFPDGLQLTSTIARMWYVGDGTLTNATQSSNVQPTITAKEQIRAGCERAIINAFENAGFDVSINGKSVRISSTQAREFLDWIGGPPPGFEYKWETDDPSLYLSLKEQAYESHPADV